jgi:cytochrome c oxidase assembly factor CtaG/ferredoxin
VETAASAAFVSWSLNWGLAGILLAALCIYARGWLHGRTLLHDQRDSGRLAAFIAGVFLVFLALASPLDAFDSLFLSAHMAQHLLLMMLAPPLLLLGKPFVPMLRGLPKGFVKEGLAPFLAWPALKRAGSILTTPPCAWLLFALSTVLWHLPFFYELALQSSVWHGVQHACFFWSGIIFWWPILEPKKHGGWPQWAFIPYLLFADIVNTALSAFFVFSGRLLYPTYSIVRASNLSATDDQILAGLIMWVPGSLVYLVPAFLLTMRVFAARSANEAHQFERIRHRQLSNFSWLTFMTRHRRWLQAGMLIVAAVVMADGWFGRQVTPLNLAGTLPWIYWRGLSVAALLIVGNLFCMACPFVLVRDLGRSVLPAKWKWPRALRNKWLAGALFVFYLWAYEALSLWNSPWMTAWLIAGYFISALLVDGLFRGASFCKYVCPIGQFHFVISLLSPREIAVKKQAVCQSCKTFDCIKGNERSRGCELDLFQPKKAGNLDCTFCLDCVKACPHDNVGLVSITPGTTLLLDTYRSSIGRLTKRYDWIALILLVTFGAFVNAGGMADPVMMWEHRWHARLGVRAMPWIVAAFVFAGTVVAPAVLVVLCGVLSIGMDTGEAVRKFAIVLAPVGVGMWAAHVAYHALGAYVPDVTPLEILLLDGGVLTALYLIWRVAGKLSSSTPGALRLAAPWAALALSLYGVGLWILFQPMQMRGMM